MNKHEEIMANVFHMHNRPQIVKKGGSNCKIINFLHYVLRKGLSFNILKVYQNQPLQTRQKTNFLVANTQYDILLNNSAIERNIEMNEVTFRMFSWSMVSIIMKSCL